MITLGSPSDYVFVFALTAIAGMIGGLAAELLLTRDGETGAFELPARKGAVLDLGGFAPVLVGGVVGVAILVVFPPETTIVTNAADNTTTSVQGYDIVRLVATSLVAGSAGGTVLSGLQARVTAAVNESRVQFTAVAATQEIDRMLDSATTIADGQAARNTAAAAAARPRGVMSDPESGEPAADLAPGTADADAMTEGLRRQAEQAKAAIAAAAAPRRS